MALLLAVGVSTIGAAPAAPVAAPLSITMPNALVIGHPLNGGIVPQDATITGCEAGNTAEIAVVHRSPGGDPLGESDLGLYPVPIGGVLNVDMEPVTQWLLDSGAVLSGSIWLGASCTGTGQSAGATMPLYALLIELPSGVTVRTLSEQQPADDATISVCPGAVSVSASFSYSVQGIPFEEPIQFVAPRAADSDGAFDFSLNAIQAWLLDTQPAAGGSVMITAWCYLPDPGASEVSGPPVASTSATILPGGMLGGPGPVAPNPDAPVESPGAAAPVPVIPETQPAEARQARAPALAATGAPLSGAALIAGAALLLGGLALRGLRRGRSRELA
jgi:hypothetical protein